MNFWQILANVAPSKPRAGFAALWWHLTRRRVRARNILHRAAADMPFAYRYWLRTQQDQAQDGRYEAGSTGLRFTVVILDTGTGREACARSLGSVLAQDFDDWQLFAPARYGIEDARIVPLVAARGRATALAQAAAKGSGAFLVPLLAGDVLASDALATLAEAAAASPDASLFYGDHDHLDRSGHRVRPWFKPRWNPDMFLAQDYVSRSCALSMATARHLLGGRDEQATPFELILGIMACEQARVHHLPHILVHAGPSEGFPDASCRAEIIERHFADRGVRAYKGPFSTVNVSWPLPQPEPLVSIIVPTRDKIDLLEPCVRSVLTQTSYPRFELLVVDNGSKDPATLSYLSAVTADPRVRILPDPSPYNYAALNNRAAEHARGEYLCLLNNDTEVITPDWLTELMRQAVRPEVGAVGAKLLYKDGTIQHAGVIVGMGDAAGHGHRFLPDRETGYFAQPHVTQAVSAVTGACLCVSATKYRAVGGLDEEALAVAYNDIDLCLKLQKAGWRNIYAPQAVLYHYESKSRIKDHLPSQFCRYSKELRLFQERWGTKDYADPLFHPHLDPCSETFVIRLR
jgi:GT2 family glycosyltransferase